MLTRIAFFCCCTAINLPSTEEVIPELFRPSHCRTHATPEYHVLLGTLVFHRFREVKTHSSDLLPDCIVEVDCSIIESYLAEMRDS